MHIYIQVNLIMFNVYLFMYMIIELVPAVVDMDSLQRAQFKCEVVGERLV